MVKDGEFSLGNGYYFYTAKLYGWKTCHIISELPGLTDDLLSSYYRVSVVCIFTSSKDMDVSGEISKLSIFGDEVK